MTESFNNLLRLPGAWAVAILIVTAVLMAFVGMVLLAIDRIPWRRLWEAQVRVRVPRNVVSIEEARRDQQACATFDAIVRGRS